MNIIKIAIKRHLSEYLESKFFKTEVDAVVLPDCLDLYHVLWDLVGKRPAGVLDEHGLKLALPHRQEGKDPRVYNWISKRGLRILEKKVELMFWAEFHDHVDYCKHVLGLDYSDSVYTFMNRHSITGISEDAMVKNYYRWRAKVRKRDIKRLYKVK